MGCNTSKNGIQAGSNRDGWALVRSLSRSWSMPYPSSQVPQNSSSSDGFHVVPLTSSTYGALDTSRSFRKSQKEEEFEEEEGEDGPGEVIDPSTPVHFKPGSDQKSSERVRVPEAIDLSAKRRKKAYGKSTSLPHIPAVFKPEKELVHGLPLVLEEKTSSPNLVNVLQKSIEKPRKPPLPPVPSGARRGLLYGASLVRDDEPLMRTPGLKVSPDASSSGYHTPQEHLESSSPGYSSLLDDEGWCLINRKLMSSEVSQESMSCLRDKTNISPIGPKTSSSFITRSLLDGFENKCPPGGQDKVVFYFTSLRGIRKTFEQCRSVRMILEGLFTRIDERDVSMHAEFRRELRSLLGSGVGVPRVFIKGRYVGGVEEVMQLNESGVLRQMVEGIPKERVKKKCAGCGGVRFIPCLECSGSCKVVGEDDEVVRCWDCNENGLVRCPVCCSD